MKKVTTKNTGEILQKIYDSEIHLRIGWLWDGGVDYSIGSTSNDIWNPKFNKANIKYTNESNMIKALNIIVKDIIKQYPKSTFVKWFIGK